MDVGKLHAQECILDLWKVQQSRPKIKFFVLVPSHGQFFPRGEGGYRRREPDKVI